MRKILKKIPKERIKELWQQANHEIVELWRDGESIIFKEHFVRLIEKEINDKRTDS